MALAGVLNGRWLFQAPSSGSQLLQQSLRSVLDVEGGMSETALFAELSWSWKVSLPGNAHSRSRRRLSGIDKGAVFHRSLIYSSTLGELTLSAEGHSLPLALEPVASHAPTDLAKMLLAP